MRHLKYFGYLITLLSLVFLASKLIAININFSKLEGGYLSIFYLLLLAPVYSLSLLIAAFCWKYIIEFLSKKNVPYKSVVNIYLKSNIAKYLPGSVMHFVGRQLLAKKMGWKHQTIAMSSFLEVFFMFATVFILLSCFLSSGVINIPKKITSQLNRNIPFLPIIFFWLLYPVFSFPDIKKTCGI